MHVRRHRGGVGPGHGPGDGLDPGRGPRRRPRGDQEGPGGLVDGHDHVVLGEPARVVRGAVGGELVTHGQPEVERPSGQSSDPAAGGQELRVAVDQRRPGRPRAGPGRGVGVARHDLRDVGERPRRRGAGEVLPRRVVGQCAGARHRRGDPELVEQRSGRLGVGLERLRRGARVVLLPHVGERVAVDVRGGGGEGERRAGRDRLVRRARDGRRAVRAHRDRAAVGLRPAVDDRADQGRRTRPG